MTDLIVRPLERHEYPLIEKVSLAPEQTLFLPERLVETKRAQVWGLWKGERLIGFVEVVGTPPLLWIARVGVDIAYQGLGYGVFLLRSVIERLRLRTRITEIRAAIHPDNQGAQHVFVKVGFQPMPSAGDPEVVFRLSLR
ncbi:MAG: GNAT family N-acetyltransferase [Bacteroidia bacterium]|nr:GNAT family N-acetyltransferase [Bacteroidia bacterium]